MLRIRFHGRGGQGMKTASRILGTAAFHAGCVVQDAPLYGAERRGAPMAAFTRIARAPILERGAIASPDVDLTNKFLKAKSMRGPKLFLAHAPCPTGWLYEPERTAEYARLAVQTGVFALKEAVDGVVTHTHIPRRRRPVQDYLQGQGRYRHLFEPYRNDSAIRQIQEQVDRYWAAV